MEYTTKYHSPLGEILIACDDEGLTGLWFTNQKYYANNLNQNHIEKETDIIKETIKWLDIYFKGINPEFTIPLHLKGTSFQMEVWHILLTIPYGKTITYGKIADILAKRRGITKMSPQAIGGSVSKNPISIIIPCHRVIGSSNSLTGYAAGINKKIELLKLEQTYKEEFYIPKNK